MQIITFCLLAIVKLVLAADREPVNGYGSSNAPGALGSDKDPAFKTCGLAPQHCSKTRYRSIDGSCNNLQKPALGMRQTPYGRLANYNYADGLSSYPVSVSGNKLPNARRISNYLFPDKTLIDPIWNLNAQQWGQIITHDMSLLAGITPSQNDNHTLTCCDEDGQLSPDADNNPQCKPILIPSDDPLHSHFGIQCINFVRTGTTRVRGCTSRYAPAKPLSTVTAYMDASFCYGSSEIQARPIRAFSGGRMKTVLRGGREWPPQDPDGAKICEFAQLQNEPCYMAGDIRVNQNPQLTVLQVIILREHNRIADILYEYNPHWDDDTLYQETRRIVIAELQYINYYEYLSIFLGYENMVKNKLIYPGARGYVNDYDAKVDPSVLVEHATAAFRHFHTLIRGYLKLITENRHLAGVVRLSDWFNRPLLIELDNAFDDLTRGLTYQSQDFSDQFWDSEITQFLFRRGNNTFGGDLRATDIERGRDHGLASYIATREACGLPVPHTFDDMLDYISKENVEILEMLYEYPEDIDLVVGGSLETNVPGAQAGPTFLCILTEQFYRTRVGDRYFFENGDPDIAFTLDQLESIRSGSSIARILCDNSDNIKHMQPKAFQKISFGNMPVPCDSLPSIDLSLWQECNMNK